MRKAQAAEEQAYKAQTIADSAKVTAEDAQITAETAQITAETAQITADSAKTTANQLQANVSEILYKTVSFTFDKQTSGRDNFVFNGWKHYKISEFAPNYTDIVSFYGTNESGDPQSIYNEGKNCYSYGFFIVVTAPGNCSITFESIEGHPVTTGFEAPSAGLYAKFVDGNPKQTAGVGEFIFSSRYSNVDANLQTIISNVGYIGVKSSTAGSTKKYKITVDDSGILTATEIIST